MKKLFVIMLIMGGVALTVLYYKNVSPLNQKIDDVVRDNTITAYGQHAIRNYSINKYVLLYFGDYGSRACGRFNKRLLSFYKKHKQGNNFDVLYVGCETTEKQMLASMLNYKMPWLGVKWNSEPNTLLRKTYSITKEPALILVDPYGMIYSESATTRSNKSPEEVLDRTRKLLERHRKNELKEEIARRYEEKEKAARKAIVEKKKKTAVTSSHWQNVFGNTEDAASKSTINVRSKFKINGLVASGSNVKAILNGKVVSIGDSLPEGFTVVSISKEGVILSLGDNQYSIPIKKSL